MCAVLIAPGQDRLLMATSNLTGVAMTNKKAEPHESEGVCRHSNSQKKKKKKQQRKSQRGNERKNKERKRKTHKDKLKGRNDMESTEIQESTLYLTVILPAKLY